MARALGRRRAAETVLWSLAILFAALAVTFALSASFRLTLVLVAVAAVAAFPFARRRGVGGGERARWPVLALGVLGGIALWHVAPPLDGDALFHLARTRKLLALDGLSLEGVGEFADGGLHPGYAFPLWHGLLAAIASLAGVDPAAVVQHEASVLAPLAFLLVYEAGAALFRTAPLAAATLAAHVGLIALAPGHGGAYTSLALPATSSRQLLVPAVVTAVFTYARQPERVLLATAAAGGLVLTLVHPTYSPFLALPLAGFVAVRALFDRADAMRVAVALGGFGVTSAAALLWLLPIVRQTTSHDPDRSELARALARYGPELDRVSEATYRLAPEVVSRSGAVAVAALALVPLAALAARRRWSAFVLGGSLAVLAVVLVPELFTRLADAASVSQSRRLAGFLPFAFALAGGAAVLARLLGPLVLGAGLAAGIALQLTYPGDFSTRLAEGGGPAGVVWFAAVGGAVALAAAALFLRKRGTLDRRGALAGGAVAAFVLPVAVHAAGSWSPRTSGHPPPLTPGLVRALRESVPERSVVFSDLETSYRILAFAPLYVAAGPPAHVADTAENRPYERRRDVIAFFARGDLAVPRRYGAGWIVVDERRFELRLPLRRVYADARYVLYRLE